MPNELQCFKPHLYASPSACSLTPNQCIAPTAQGSRCKLRINSEDLARAMQREFQAQTMAHGPERDEIISEYILLHCCNKCHRAKLAADPTGCLEELIKRYGAEIGEAKFKPLVKHETTSPEPLTTIPQPEPQRLFKRESTRTPTPERQNGMKLRSGTRIPDSTTTSTSLQESIPYFSSYKSTPTHTIRSHLLQTTHRDRATQGTIYSFTWRAHPQYIKIGYTASSAEERVRSWQPCNPGATLSHQAKFAYPLRIERLIHLQLSQRRHRIAVCNTCKRSHVEWFKASAEEVNSVIEDWAEVVRREALYGSDGQLTPRWRQRIEKFSGEVTARGLLELLDAEAAVRARVKSDHRVRFTARDDEVSTAVDADADADADTITDTIKDLKSETQPDLEIAAQLAATAIRTLQNNEQIFSFIQEFMTLLSRWEELEGGSGSRNGRASEKVRIRTPGVGADLGRSESLMSPTIMSAA